MVGVCETRQEALGRHRFKRRNVKRDEKVQEMIDNVQNNSSTSKILEE